MTDRPSVSSHLQIPLGEFDHRIRTFVPYYEEMLGELQRVMGLIAKEGSTFLDLGIGTGALAERFLQAHPGGRVIGIDSDQDILEMARARLGGFPGVDLRAGDFMAGELPRADLIGASISFHHVPEPDLKKGLYTRCRSALNEGGALLMADCFPPSQVNLAEEGWAAWLRHLEGHYDAGEARGFLEAWSEEDTHFSLAEELSWLGEVGFGAEVVWRKDLFAVIVCS